MHGVAEGANVLISGRTGSGKTTLLNALAATLPDHERILLIEAPAEIAIDKPNLVRLEARLEELPLGRLRPDRIVVGETRGADAWEWLQCWNSGHSGSLSTIHANSAALAITRFVHCVLMAQMNLPAAGIRQDLGDMLRYVVHVDLDKSNPRFYASLTILNAMQSADRPIPAALVEELKSAQARQPGPLSAGALTALDDPNRKR